MHEYIDDTDAQQETLTPLQIFHDGFDEWVLWLRSIVRDCEKHDPGRNNLRGEESAHASKYPALNTGHERDEDARRVDDGGVSLVVSDDMHTG